MDETKSKKVSIIVPCYKQAEYLSETLDSVLVQTYPYWECVIVNDGSPDNTEEIAMHYCRKDMRFKYVSQKNKGLASARNMGIANSSGEFILPLDADDLIAPTYLEKAVDRFICFPETKLVYCKAVKFGKENCYWDLPPFNYEQFIWSNCIFCSALFRRSDYDQTSGYRVDLIYGNEDWDFWLTLLKKDDVVHRIEEVLFYYRTKDCSMVTELAKHHVEESLIQICKNHPEIYSPYYYQIFYYQNINEEVSKLTREIKQIRSSHTYRLGKFLLKPLSLLRHRK